MLCARSRSERIERCALRKHWVPLRAYATIVTVRHGEVGMARFWFRMVFAASLLASCAIACAADAFPTKPIRIVVPFAAGGSTDILARSIAQRLNEALRSPVIVDNRAGGAGVIGAEHVAKSASDGYTLLMATNTTI